MISSEATLTDLLSPADSNDISDENLDKPKRYTLSAARNAGKCSTVIVYPLKTFHSRSNSFQYFDSFLQIVGYLRLEDQKHELLVVKMLHSVDGPGKYQSEELHSLDFQAPTDVAVLSSMRIGSPQPDIVLMSKFNRRTCYYIDDEVNANNS